MVAGLILAAGDGSRFGAGRSKLLADLNGRPLLEWAIRAQCEVPALGRIVVVLGARADEVRAALDFDRAEPVVCAEWADGQSASLRCGLAALGEGVDRVVVTLGDTPLPSRVVRLFTDQPARARAVYHGRPGHPVVLGRKEISAALAGITGDQGARALLEGGPRLEVGHLCSGRDVDTPQDLEAISDEARAVIRG